MAITWTGDKANAAITDETQIGKITNAYQAAWRHEEKGALGSLGPADFCSVGDGQKAVKAAKKVVEFLAPYSAMALSSLHLVPLYNSQLFDPANLPPDPGVENPNVSWHFKVFEQGNPKPHKRAVFLPAAILPDADSMDTIGRELQDMFNGRSASGTQGQPDYRPAYTKLLPTGYTCRFVQAKSGTDRRR